MADCGVRFRVGLLTSHPIQYQAPWFRELARVVDLEVFFAHRQSAAEQGKAGFGVAFDWDVDLLSGYRHHFLKNVSANPGADRYAGCDTPEIAQIIRRGESPREPSAGASGEQKASTGSSGVWPHRCDDPLPPFDAFILCGWYLKAYLQAARACRAAGVPVLVRGDSQLRTPRPFLKRLAMAVRQRWLLRRFDGFLSVGQRHREYLEHFGVPAEKIFFVPHFVDNAWFRQRAAAARTQREAIRRQWGAEAGTVIALFVGKLQPEKRPQDLLQSLSASSLQRSRLSLLAVLVGAGGLEAELRRIAARDRVNAFFAGFKNQTELPACYAAADVLVLPSGSETWGLAVNEAMACGLPAIVSDAVGCAPDLIEEGRTGFTYSVGDTVQLARRLETLGEMRSRGHDFRPALEAKLRTYSVEAAVAQTVMAVAMLTRTQR